MGDATTRAVEKAAKQVAESIKTLFFTPFSRMQRFLYMGISPQDDIFILGTDQEREFRYGNPEQGLGMVYLKTSAISDGIRTWFAALAIDNTRREVINLIQIGTFFNKCKWDLSRVTVTRDAHDCLTLTLDTGESETVSEPIQTYFAFEQIRLLAHAYIDALVHKTTDVYRYPYRGDDTVRVSNITITLPADNAVFPNGYIRLVLARGLDWLIVKNLPAYQDCDFVGVCLWSPSGTSFYYTHTYETESLLLATTRCNFFLVPR